MRETTALGAAIAAGIAVGVWNSLEDLHQVNAEGQTTFRSTLAEKGKFCVGYFVREIRRRITNFILFKKKKKKIGPHRARGAIFSMGKGRRAELRVD